MEFSLRLKYGLALGAIIYFDTLFKSSAVNMMEEQNLFEELFTVRKYDKRVRPVMNVSQVVEVQLALYVSMLNNIDEKLQTFSWSGWIQSLWLDERLSWNPDDYGGMTMLVVPPDYVWLPCFVLYNTASDKLYYNEHYTRFKVQITHKGMVNWAPGGKYTTICEINVQYYPFDDQVCMITFLNWVYVGRQVNLRDMDHALEKLLSAYSENSEWEILETFITKHVNVINNVTFPEVHFGLHIQRKPLFYIVTIIIPSVMLSFLVLLVFRLPPESGEKMSMGVTLLLSYSVLILMVSENVPRTSTAIPLLALYLLVCMVHSGLTVCISVMILAIHHRQPQTHPPAWLLRYAHWTTTKRKPIQGETQIKLLPSMTNQNEASKTGGDSIVNVNYVHRNSRDSVTERLLTTMQRILSHLETETNKTQVADHPEQILLEWKEIAVALDTLLFWLFLIIILTAGLIILVIIPMTKSQQKN